MNHQNHVVYSLVIQHFAMEAMAHLWMICHGKEWCCYIALRLPEGKWISAVDFEETSGSSLAPLVIKDDKVKHWMKVFTLYPLKGR